MNINGFFSAILAASLFGMIPTFTKISYGYQISPQLAVFTRYVLALILIIVPFIIYKNNYKIIKQKIFLLLLISLGSICLSTGLLVSVIFIPVSLVALIFYTYPLIVLGYSSIFGKKLNKIQIVGFFLAFAGLGLALGPNFETLNIYGIMLALLASIGAATILITNEILAKDLNPFTINAFVNFFCFLVLALVIGINFDIDLNVPNLGKIYIFFASLFYCAAFFAQLIAVSYIGSTKTSLILYLEPIVAIISAIILLNESLTKIQTLGTIIVIFSLVISLRKNTNQLYSS